MFVRLCVHQSPLLPPNPIFIVIFSWIYSRTVLLDSYTYNTLNNRLLLKQNFRHLARIVFFFRTFCTTPALLT